jgi:hypothetical protein
MITLIMKFIFLIIIAFSLSSCLEDKGALLAQCKIDANENSKLYGDAKLEFLENCMRAKGYKLFYDVDTNCNTIAVLSASREECFKRA